MLTVFECAQSSTYHVLVAILFVLVSLGQFMSGVTVKWFSDSQGAARIVRVGGMHFNLHNFAPTFFLFALIMESSSTLSGFWVRRTKKPITLVKLFTTMIWSLSRKNSVYWMADGVPIPSTVLPRFTIAKFLDFSLAFWNPCSSGVDAFFQAWQGENCWVVPPAFLLSKALYFMFLL